MKVTFFPDNGTLTGKPEVIVDLMRTTWDIRYGMGYAPFSPDAVNEYIDYVISFYNKKGIHLNVEGSTYSERSESLLKEMERNKLLYVHKEELVCQ